MEFARVDGTDEALLAAYYDVYERSQMLGRSWASHWRLPEIAADLRDPSKHRRLALYAGLVEGRVVTTGALEVPLRDNLTSAQLAVDTDPGQRCRGYGGAMLAHLEARAADEGRTRFDTETSYPYDGPADGAGHPYADFLTHRGYRFGLGDVQRALDLPVPTELLDRLAAEAAPHHTAYRLVEVSSPMPEEYLAGYAALDAVVGTEAPTGDLEIEPGSTDPEVMRDLERSQMAMGRTIYSTLALDAAGSVVAFSTIGVSDHEPDQAFQWGTLVDRAHRGHRLGLAVKVANARRIAEVAPHLSRIVTWNAESNAYMVAVNDALGFRPVERLGEFQKIIG